MSQGFALGMVLYELGPFNLRHFIVVWRVNSSLALAFFLRPRHCMVMRFWLGLVFCHWRVVFWAWYPKHFIFHLVLSYYFHFIVHNQNFLVQASSLFCFMSLQFPSHAQKKRYKHYHAWPKWPKPKLVRWNQPNQRLSVQFGFVMSIKLVWFGFLFVKLKILRSVGELGKLSSASHRTYQAYKQPYMSAHSHEGHHASALSLGPLPHHPIIISFMLWDRNIWLTAGGTNLISIK